MDISASTVLGLILAGSTSLLILARAVRALRRRDQDHARDEA